MRTSRNASLFLAAVCGLNFLGGCALPGGAVGGSTSASSSAAPCAQSWFAKGSQNFDVNGNPTPFATLYCGEQVVGTHYTIDVVGADGKQQRKVCWQITGSPPLCGSQKVVVDPGDHAHGALAYVVIDDRPTDHPAVAQCNFMARDLVVGAVHRGLYVVNEYTARYTCRPTPPTLADLLRAP